MARFKRSFVPFERGNLGITDGKSVDASVINWIQSRVNRVICNGREEGIFNPPRYDV